MPTPQATPLAAQLDRWERAGLIEPAQGRRILEFESAAGVGQPGSGGGGAFAASEVERPTRPSGTELLAYLGVVVALAGVVTLVYASGATLWLIAALTLSIGLVALAAMREFVRRGGSPSARAAGACLALGAAATGTALGEFAAAASVFARTVITDPHCGVPSACPPYPATDRSGDVLLAAAVVTAIALGLLRFVPGRLPAGIAVAAWYVAAVAAVNVAQLDADRSSVAVSLVLVAFGAVLVGLGEVVPARERDVLGFLGFAGVVGATIPLYFIAGGSGGHLDVLAGLLALAALGAGLALPRRGVAFGAVIGLAGLIGDIGVRNFHTPMALGLFFSISGVAAVMGLVAVTRLLRGNSRPHGAGRLS